MSLAANLATFAANSLVSPPVGLATPWELIEKKSPALNDTTIDFTNLPSGFDRFYLEVDGLGVVTDNAVPFLRVQTGGSTWQTTGYQYVVAQSATVQSHITESLTSAIALTMAGVGNAVGNAADEGFSARIDFNAKQSTTLRRFRYMTDFNRPDTVPISSNGAGHYGGSAAITGVRLTPSTGGFKGQGSVKLFGLRN